MKKPKLPTRAPSRKLTAEVKALARMLFVELWKKNPRSLQNTALGDAHADYTLCVNVAKMVEKLSSHEWVEDA